MDKTRLCKSLFVVSPNNSGSTFLSFALAACRTRAAAACFALQRRNVGALAPALDDLDLRRRLRVKGQYHETLTDMNARQIARLDAAQLAALNRVFREREDLLAWFGYRIMDTAA